MPVTAWIIPNSAAADTLASTTWTTPTNILADDGALVQESITAKNVPATTGSNDTGWLRCSYLSSQFSTIPVGATITLVRIRAEWHLAAAGSGIGNLDLRWAVGATLGTPVHTNAAEPTVAGTVDTYDVTAERSWVRADFLTGDAFDIHVRGRNGNNAGNPGYRFDVVAVEVTYSVGQTVNANQVTETETSQAVVVARVVAPGQTVEAETAQMGTGWDNAAVWVNADPWLHPTIRVQKNVALGQPLETESAQPVTIGMGGGQTIPLAQTVETETAQAVTLRKTETAAQTTETETAQPVTLRKTETAAQTVETETAQPVTLRKTETAGQPAETETAQPVTIRKTETLGQVVETELAQGITLGGVQNIPLGQALETETAQPVTLDKIVQLDNLYDDILGEFYFSPVETETAQTITVRATRSFALGTAVEVETAAALVVVGGAPAFTPGFSRATVTLAAGGSSTITGPNGSASVSKRPVGAASIR